MNLYAKATIPHRKNYAVKPVGKPALNRDIKNVTPLGAETVTNDETIRNRLRVLAAVEDGVGAIYDQLKNIQQLDNTLFIVTSDEGYFYGEFGLSVERRLAYEESVRIPLFIRYSEINSRWQPHRSDGAEYRHCANTPGNRRRRNSHKHGWQIACSVAEGRENTVVKFFFHRILFG